MKKTFIFSILLSTITLFSCGNQPSQETLKLEKELDSIKRYGKVLEKYELFKLDLQSAGASKEESKKVADSTYNAAHPEFTKAEWNTK